MEEVKTDGWLVLHKVGNRKVVPFYLVTPRMDSILYHNDIFSWYTCYKEVN